MDNEKAPHYKIFKAVSSDAMTQTVKDNLRNKQISAIDSQANAFFNVEFPKGGKIGNKNTDEKLKKELAKFVVNLFYIFYPESCVTEKDLEKIKKESFQKVPDVGNVLGNAFKSKGKKQKSEKPINKKVETNKEENKNPRIKEKNTEKLESENPKIEEPRTEEQKIGTPETEKVEINNTEIENPLDSLISALNSFSSGVLSTVIFNNGRSRFDKVLNSCVALVNKLLNDTGNYEKENSEVASVIGKIRKASENFSEKRDVYKGRIYKSDSIPTLYKELTGKEVSADDIVLAKRGRVVNEIEGLDNSSVFYKPVKDCLNAFMCIYAARYREEFFDELYDSSSQEFLGKGGYGGVYSINKRKNDKRKAVKEFHRKGDFAFGAKSAHEVNAALESDLDKIRQIKHSMKSEGKDYKKNKDYKESKEKLNRIALSKIVDGKLVSKRAECDLFNFIKDKFSKIILNDVKKINNSNVGDQEKKEEREKYTNKVIEGFKQLIKDMKTSVQQLHDANMCHRDIKPENFLVFSSKSKKSLGYKCKLSDLDTKGNLGEEFKFDYVGTQDFAPRDIFIGGKKHEFYCKFAYGEAGTKVAKLMDLYALRESIREIGYMIADYPENEIRKISTKLASICFDEVEDLDKHYNRFKMFESLESIKEFLIDNGSPDKTAMEEYIKGGTSLKKNDNAPQENDNGHPAENLGKSKSFEGGGLLQKTRPL